MERKGTSKLLIALFAAVFALGIAPTAAFAAPADANLQGGVVAQEEGDDDSGEDEGEGDEAQYCIELTGVQEYNGDYYLTGNDEELGVVLKKDGELVDLGEGYFTIYRDGEEVESIEGAGSYSIVAYDSEGGWLAEDYFTIIDPYSLESAKVYINGWRVDSENVEKIPEGEFGLEVYPNVPFDEDDDEGPEALVEGVDYKLT